MMDAKVKGGRAPWKSAMTARERFVNQMHYKPFDRSYNMEFGYWPETLTQWKMFSDNDVAGEKIWDFFGFDPLVPTLTGGATWLLPVFEEKIIEEKGDILVVQNHDGNTAEIPRDRHQTIPHYTGSVIKTPEDWKRVKEERFNRTDPRRKADIGKLKERAPAGREFPLGVSTGSMIGKIRDLLTFEGVCFAQYDYPDMLEDMVETCCSLVEDWLDQILPEIEFDYAYCWEDICYKQGPILSVDFFENVVGPRYKRIHKKLIKYGVDIHITDCDGDVRPILPMFLENGVNCLQPYEVNACTHPGALLDEFGGELRIMGGFDKMKLYEGPEAIKAYLESLEPYVARGGYVPHCDHGVPYDVPEDNYLYYLNLKEKMFGMEA